MPKKFRKRFRCGRAVLSLDGKVKKLSLEQGGGSRYCLWYHSYMNFESVREELVRLYKLSKFSPIDPSIFSLFFDVRDQ